MPVYTEKTFHSFKNQSTGVLPTKRKQKRWQDYPIEFKAKSVCEKLSSPIGEITNPGLHLSDQAANKTQKIVGLWAIISRILRWWSDSGKMVNRFYGEHFDRMVPIKTGFYMWYDSE